MPNTITLRSVIPSDLPVFYEHQRDPQACALANFPAREYEPFMAHWEKIMRVESNILKTIVVDEKVAGNIVSWEQENEREIGYWLGREYWGQGIATRALTQFLQTVNLRPLYAYVAGHNAASRRVLEKCGFTTCAENSTTGMIKLSLPGNKSAA